jgi:hypothetical protein
VVSVAATIAPPETVALDLVTVACNNSLVVSEQIRLLRANLRDQFAYTVIDNSPDRSLQAEIESICRRENVPYIRLPRTPSSAYDPSCSHGRALNWAVTNYLRPRSVRRFGFLDHDVFPVRPTSLLSHLQDQPVWGLLQTRGERWYLWPGLCVFDAAWLGDRRLDFMPGSGFDVGGRLYDLMRDSLSQQSLEWPTLAHERLREGGDILQKHLYQRIDDWIHTVNASGWMPVEGKDQPVADLLSQF